MVTFPPAKINLGLQIISRRNNGFHNIETGFYPLPLTDILEVLPSTYLEINQTGLPIDGQKETNICLTAYTLLAADFSLPPVKIHLHKIIPIGAGLGGGSADGAHMLLSLNKLFQLNLSNEQLMAYALQLGSDCSFFLQNNPMIGKRQGEKLTPTTVCLKGYQIMIIKPSFKIATEEAYQWIIPMSPPASVATLIANPLATWKNTLTNDFETATFERFPILAELKDQLYCSGALYAAMSGSGSALFGIFDHAAPINDLFPDHWKWSGKL